MCEPMGLEALGMAISKIGFPRKVQIINRFWKDILNTVMNSTTLELFKKLERSHSLFSSWIQVILEVIISMRGKQTILNYKNQKIWQNHKKGWR